MFNDPWKAASDSTTTVNSTQLPIQSAADAFEDNFQPSTAAASDLNIAHTKLPDSEEYLASLERKLSKLKSDTGVLQQLTSRREHCLQSLLRGSIDLPTDADFGLDHLSGDSEHGRTEELIRHIIPERAIHPVELVHIIDYDQLQPPPQSDEDTSATDAVEAKEHSDSVSR